MKLWGFEWARCDLDDLARGRSREANIAFTATGVNAFVWITTSCDVTLIITVDLDPPLERNFGVVLEFRRVRVVLVLQVPCYPFAITVYPKIQFSRYNGF